MKGTWTKVFESAILGNRAKINFAFTAMAVTVGKLCYDASDNIVTAGAAGLGGAFVGFLAFGFIGGLVCGIRDEFVKKRALRKNNGNDRNEEEEDV